MFDYIKKSGLYLVVLMLFVTSSLYAQDKVFFLPNDSNNAKKEILDLIDDSSSSIDIAVYNFQYKKIAKALKKAAKNGVKIRIVFDNEKRKKKKSQYEKLCTSKNIECKVTKDIKQHIKMIIFDKKIAMMGSLNLTKDSFNKNHELVYITDNKKVVKKLNKGFSNFFVIF